MKIFLISGKARHGKNTFSSFCKEYLETNGKKVLELAFADYLKYFCKQYLNWDGQKDEAGRKLLQETGDILRRNNVNVFTNILKEVIQSVKSEYDYIFVTDCRFKNEVEVMKETFPEEVITIRVNRPDFQNDLTEEQRKHKSEVDLDDYQFDVEILNCDTLDTLKQIALYFTYTI